MKQRKSTEDYLKTIYILESQQGVHGSDVARMLKVTRPTVSIALKALEQEGYVLDKTSIVADVDVMGYPFQEYTMIRYEKERRR